jgi:hypothetical protein|tara:strand:+ start:151 stop:291 length:141 start_codon:yes stop_codon:yes gene_type:complete
MKRNKADMNGMTALERLNYLSAITGLMCLRDYRDWEETLCPCPECK